MKASSSRQTNPQPIARQRYESTAPGGFGSIIYTGTPDNDVEWEQFAAQVSVLDDMADDGLVKIVERHGETETGERNIDRVDFKRIDCAGAAPEQPQACRASK